MMSQPLRIVIVDDEAPARRRMAELLEDARAAVPNMVIGEGITGTEGLALCQGQVAPDVVLMDIQMPDMTGLECAQHLLKLPAPPGIIFVTAYDDYAVKAFELHAIDYLLKPVRLERLIGALQKVRPITNTQVDAMPKTARRFLSVTERGRVMLVPIDDVLFFRADNKYIAIKTLEREYLLEDSLNRLEEEYGDKFVRTHRNSLIAREQIVGFEKGDGDEESTWTVVLQSSKERLPVSRRQQHIVKEFSKRS
jgi:two-component system, LytTR family, response regulator AlgR